MPKGEEMFNYHGLTGPCPQTNTEEKIESRRFEGEWQEAMKKLAIAIYALENIKAIIGPPGCQKNKCEGCEFEAAETASIASKALAEINRE